MRLASDGLQQEMFMQRSGCRARRCAFVVDYHIDRKSWRVTHNGVRFSHATDIDELVAKTAPDGGMERLFGLWTAEHHAGRSGYEIPFTTADGAPTVVMMPEADA